MEQVQRNERKERVMEQMSCDEILKATGGILLSGKILSGGKNTVISGISTDSRRVKNGDLFVPIKGERFDGHDFIAGAFENGAAATLSSNKNIDIENHAVIIVEDTVKAFGKIAAYYRNKFSIPFIAITGSVGKTATKDMIACVLGQKYNVMKTAGNFNNEIGLPLTIMSLDKQHEAAVVEMGMSGPGEIAILSDIVRPDISVITNIGISHIEKLGSKENILKAKLEILEGMDEARGLLILNSDDEMLRRNKPVSDIRTVFYGLDNKAELHAENISIKGNKTEFDIKLGRETYRASIPVPGKFMVYNSLAAIAAALELKMDPISIIKGLSLYQTGSMRMNIEELSGYTIINDAYNASPDSVKAALQVLMTMEGKRKIAVLGDMLELGKWAEEEHAAIGRFAYNSGVDILIGVGEKALSIADGAIKAGMHYAAVYAEKLNADTVEFLKGFIKNGDVILIKGSRGMKMEEISEDLLKEIRKTEEKH